MRLLLISNRLPVTLKEDLSLVPSTGGLANGMHDFLNYYFKEEKRELKDYLWLGWCGKALSPSEEKQIDKELEKKHYKSVFLNENQISNFYDGFCNKTIWPLFHYFPTFATYDEEHWSKYIEVNRVFFENFQHVYEEGDTIWIHDYHLMFLPEMIREAYPNAKIGFFLHIPFPSFEILRLLPRKWRAMLLNGLLGADLIGFHTYDYVQYFLGCVQRILGYDNDMGKIFIQNRVIKADAFPMGINFKKFQDGDENPEVFREIKKLKEKSRGTKTILSIDRLDYTKGILKRLLGYEKFLKDNPNWHEKVSLLLLILPSREEIDNYQQIKNKIEALVGQINGSYGNIHWSPIIYQYKLFDFSTLEAIYKTSDIALVTPLRDGMNLIAKEFIAAHKDKKGCLILSEMAGAAKELGEALIINPNNISEIADSLKEALQMPEEELMRKNSLMQERLKSYNIYSWGTDFLQSLKKIVYEEEKNKLRFLSPPLIEKIKNEFKTCKCVFLFLDYDGSLTPLKRYPELAKPDKEILDTLNELTNLPNINVVLISGRKKEKLSEWFPIEKLGLIAEHGAWIKEKGFTWNALVKQLSTKWKQTIRPILQTYTNHVPGSFIEEKDFSLCWHYRNADPECGSVQAKELMADLLNYIANTELQTLQGNKILEIRNVNINKGIAANFFIEKYKPDFILAVGDDVTDEDLFNKLPQSAYTIKVGFESSKARYFVYNCSQILELLQNLK